MSDLFSARLKSLRGERNKAEFARILGIPAPMYHRYELGQVPKTDNLQVIADKCGVSIDWLLNGSVDPPGKPSGGIDWRSRAESAEKKLEKLRAAIKNFNKVVEHLEGAL